MDRAGSGWCGFGCRGYIFGKRDSKPAEVTQPTIILTPTPTPQAEQGQTSEEAEVKEISVEGDEYSFSPASISVKKGERVRLTFKNVGKFPHNLTIDELEVETKTISGGSQDVVEFVADEQMELEFYCSVGSHRSQGMEGSLTVE